MKRPSTFILISGAVLGIASIVVYFALGHALVAAVLMVVALSDAAIGVFLRQRLDR